MTLARCSFASFVFAAVVFLFGGLMPAAFGPGEMASGPLPSFCLFPIVAFYVHHAIFRSL